MSDAQQRAELAVQELHVISAVCTERTYANLPSALAVPALLMGAACSASWASPGAVDSQLQHRRQIPNSPWVLIEAASVAHRSVFRS
jgi:hypothetical protein